MKDTPKNLIIWEYDLTKNAAEKVWQKEETSPTSRWTVPSGQFITTFPAEESPEMVV